MMLNIRQNAEAVQPQASSSGITIQSEIESKNGRKHKKKKKKNIKTDDKQQLNLQSENEKTQLGSKKLEKTNKQILFENEQKQKAQNSIENKDKQTKLEPIENLNSNVDKLVKRKKVDNQCNSNMKGLEKKKSNSDNNEAMNSNFLPMEGKNDKVIPKKKRRRSRRKKLAIQANDEMQDTVKQSKDEVAVQITEDLRNKEKISKLEITPSANENYNNQLVHAVRKSDESKILDDVKKILEEVENKAKQKNTVFSYESTSLKENRKMIDGCQVEEEMIQIEGWKNVEFCLAEVKYTEENSSNCELKQAQKEENGGNGFSGYFEKQNNSQMIDGLVLIEENTDLMNRDLIKISKRNDEDHFKSELKLTEDSEDKNSNSFKNETIRKSEWNDTYQDRNDYKDVCNVIENLLMILESGDSEPKEESMQYQNKMEKNDKSHHIRTVKQIKEEISNCQHESVEVIDKKKENDKLIQIVERNKDKTPCQTIVMQEGTGVNCNQLEELKNVEEDSNGILFSLESVWLDKLEEKNGKGQLMEEIQCQGDDEESLRKQNCLLYSDRCTLIDKSKQIEAEKTSDDSNFMKDLIQNKENPEGNEDHPETREGREFIKNNDDSINSLIVTKNEKEENENWTICELMQPDENKENNNDNLLVNELITMEEKLKKHDCLSEVELRHLENEMDKSDDNCGRIEHNDEKIKYTKTESCKVVKIEEQQNNIIYDLEGGITHLKEKMNDNSTAEMMHNDETNEAANLFCNFIKIREKISSDNCQPEEKAILSQENIVENSDNSNGEGIPCIDKGKVVHLTYESVQNQDIESDENKLKNEVTQNKENSEENGSGEFIEFVEFCLSDNYNDFHSTCDLLQNTDKTEWNSGNCLINELISEQKEKHNEDKLSFTEENKQRLNDSFDSKKTAMNEENEVKYGADNQSRREELIEIEDKDCNDSVSEVHEEIVNEKYDFAQKIEINDCDVAEKIELEKVEESNNDQIVCEIIRIELIKNNCQAPNKLHQIEKEEPEGAIVTEGSLSQGEMALLQLDSCNFSADKMLFQHQKQKEITDQVSSENHFITGHLEHSGKISTSNIEKVAIEANKNDCSYLQEEIKFDSQEDDGRSLKVVENQDEGNNIVQPNQTIHSVNNQQNKEIISTPEVICEKALIKQSDFADEQIEEGSTILDQETQKIISLFKVIMKAFKEERQNIQAKKTEKTSLLIEAMKLITAKIAKKKCVTSADLSISYHLPELRCAYLYINLLCNIEINRKFLGWSRNLIPTDLQSKLHICSIGGGPGTDILGIWKLIQDVSWWSNKEIICHIFDLFGHWRNTYKRLKEMLDPDNKFRCSTTYNTLNFLKNIENIFPAIDSADLVMVVKFVSSVLTDNNNKVCRENFKKIAQRMKPDAVLFFVDDADGGYLKFMTGIADECGLINHYCISSYEFDFISPEHLHHLEIYKEEFDGFVPKTADKLAFAVWKKRAKVIPVEKPLQSFQESQKKTEVSQKTVTVPCVDKSKNHCNEEEKNGSSIGMAQNQTKNKDPLFADNFKPKEEKSTDKKINSPEIVICKNASVGHSNFTDLQIKEGTVKVATLNENTEKTISLFNIIMKVFRKETLGIHSKKAKRVSLLLDAMKLITKNIPEKKNLPSKLLAINYDLSEFRCAYLYIHLLYNIEIVQKFLEWSASLILLDLQSKLHVCSIGGGPGTDVFSLLKLKQEVSWWADKEITANIFDIYGQWKNTNDNLRKKLDPDNKLTSVTYRTINFLRNSYPNIASADLVMVVNFVSSVLTADNKTVCKEMFKQMIRRMKPNAVLFFVDSAEGDYLKFMTEISAECGLFEGHSVKSYEFDLISPQDLHHLEVFKKEFDGIVPKTKDKVALSVWKKLPLTSPQKTQISQNSISDKVNLLFLHILAVIKEEEMTVTKKQPGDYFAVVKNALCLMARLYSTKNLQLDSPKSLNFDLSEYRCAYLYKFVTCHVNFIKEYLRQIELVIQTKMKTQNQFVVCSIGGGPGSDLFGVMQFLQEAVWWKGTINAKLFDLHTWQDTFEKLRRRLDPEKKYLKKASYEYCDVFKNPEKTYSFVSSADLIMMVKLLSAVLSPHTRSECEAALKKIIAKMKPNSLFFFIDNTGGGSLTLMREIAKNSNMKEVFVKRMVSFQLKELDLIQFSSIYPLFGHIVPQNECNLSVAIWQKQPESYYLTLKNNVLVKGGIKVVADIESQYIDVANKQKSSGPSVSWPISVEGEQLHVSGNNDKAVSSAQHVDNVNLKCSEIDRYYQDDALLTENKSTTNKHQENGIQAVNSVSVDDICNTLMPYHAVDNHNQETEVNEEDLVENLAELECEKIIFPEMGKIMENISQLKKCYSQIKIDEVITSDTPSMLSSEANTSVDFLKKFPEQQNNNALPGMLSNPVNNLQYTSSIMVDKVRLSHVWNLLTERNFSNPEKCYKELSETTDKTMVDSVDFILNQSSTNEDLAEYTVTVDAHEDMQDSFRNSLEETVSKNNLQTKRLITYNREELFDMREKLLFSCRGMCQLQNDIESYILHSTENESTISESLVQDSLHCCIDINIRIKDLVKRILEKSNQTVDDIEVLSWIQSLLRLLQGKRIPIIDIVPSDIMEHQKCIEQLIQFLKENRPRGEFVKTANSITDSTSQSDAKTSKKKKKKKLSCTELVKEDTQVKNFSQEILGSAEPSKAQQYFINHSYHSKTGVKALNIQQKDICLIQDSCYLDYYYISNTLKNSRTDVCCLFTLLNLWDSLYLQNISKVNCHHSLSIARKALDLHRCNFSWERIFTSLLFGKLYKLILF